MCASLQIIIIKSQHKVINRSNAAKVLEKSLKLKGCLWTRDNVHELIYRKYGIDMPIRTIGGYLKRWGSTVQRPAKREMEQKPEQVEAWLNEEYPAIHNESKAEKAVIFWGNETAVQNTANYAGGYSPKGKTPILKVKAKKMHINMISTMIDSN